MAFSFKILKFIFKAVFLTSIVAAVGAILIVGSVVIPLAVSMHGQELRAAWISELTQDSVYQVFIPLPNGRQITGTAFHVLDDKGVKRLITNKHVCYTDKHYPIKLYNTASGKRYRTKIKRISPVSDLCELAVVKTAPALELDHRFRKDQAVFSAGHPGSMMFQVSEGIIVDYMESWNYFPVEISGKKNCLKYKGELKWQKNRQGMRLMCLSPAMGIATNIPLIPGASGSPLLTASGKVVGVINKVNEAHWGVAVPLSETRAFLNNKE